MYSDDFIEGLPKDPKDALYAICKYLLQIDEGLSSYPLKEEMYEEYIKVFAAMEVLTKACALPFSLTPFKGDIQGDTDRLVKYCLQLRDKFEKKEAEVTLDTARDEFRSKFNVGFLYEFSDGDLKRIQTLINELRDLITESKLFDADHKQRILTKLEKLQSELHKRMSSLDRFWPLMGEAGVAFGKFGNDAKPFVDRITEILKAAWNTQARAEELPSGMSLPLLSDTNPKEKSARSKK